MEAGGPWLGGECQERGGRDSGPSWLRLGSGPWKGGQKVVLNLVG